MVFIDLLTGQLFVLGFSGLILAYTVINGALSYRKGKDFEKVMKSGQIPLALLGAYIFITGVYGQFTWPLPGSYNILYYDIFPLWGIFLMASAWALRSKLNLQYVGFMALLIGAMSVFYGYTGYQLGLSQAPIAVLGLFGLFGLSGIFGFPVTMMFDRAMEKKKNASAVWMVLLAVFLIALILASLLAIYIGVSAVPAHLASAP